MSPPSCLVHNLPPPKVLDPLPREWGDWLYGCCRTNGRWLPQMQRTNHILQFNPLLQIEWPAVRKKSYFQLTCVAMSSKNVVRYVQRYCVKQPFPKHWIGLKREAQNPWRATILVFGVTKCASFAGSIFWGDTGSTPTGWRPWASTSCTIAGIVIPGKNSTWRTEGRLL